MTIFQVPDQTPTVETFANGWLQTANAQAQDLLNRSYDDVHQFWFRNRDINGNSSPVKHDPATREDGTEYPGSQEPTGVELLQAMGQQAGLFLGLAWAKVAGIVQADQQYSLGIVDLDKLLPPYELEWNPDGTLKNATLKD